MPTSGTNSTSLPRRFDGQQDDFEFRASGVASGFWYWDGQGADTHITFSMYRKYRYSNERCSCSFEQIDSSLISKVPIMAVFSTHSSADFSTVLHRTQALERFQCYPSRSRSLPQPHPCMIYEASCLLRLGALRSRLTAPLVHQAAGLGGMVEQGSLWHISS